MENEGGKADLKRARSYVLWLLARRDYPRRTLEEKLKKKELSSSEIKTLLDALSEDGLYREDIFKKLRTRQLIRQGYGPSLIKAKMSRDRVVPTNEELDASYLDLDISQEAQLRHLIEKHSKRYANRGLNPRQFKQKLVQSLLRKGFSISLVLKALNEPPLEKTCEAVPKE
ncbi:MAG: RecX family transcriptional regulator [Bdellovibrionota bacterium]